MKHTKLIITTILASAAFSHAAWLWDPATVTGDASGASGTSLNWSVAPGNSVGGLPGLVGVGWDVAAQPVSFSATSSSSDPISWAFDAVTGVGTVAGTANPAFTYIDIDLDPDGNGILPTEITFFINYPLGVTSRGSIGNGGIGWLPNSGLGDFGTIDAEMNYWDANGDPIFLDSTFDDNTFLSPTYTASGGIQYTNYNNWAGLFDTNNGPTEQFVFGAGDPTKEIGTQKVILSNFANSGATTSIRFSLDGGVSTTASSVTPIPEPTSFVLLGLGGLGLVTRRKR